MQCIVCIGKHWLCTSVVWKLKYTTFKINTNNFLAGGNKVLFTTYELCITPELSWTDLSYVQGCNKSTQLRRHVH